MILWNLMILRNLMIFVRRQQCYANMVFYRQIKGVKQERNSDQDHLGTGWENSLLLVGALIENEKKAG